MKHPTKEVFVTALRHAVLQLERELVIPEDPEEVECLTADGVMPTLAAWMMREMYLWGYTAGYEEASVLPLHKSPTKIKAPSQATLDEMFGDEEAEGGEPCR